MKHAFCHNLQSQEHCIRRKGRKHVATVSIPHSHKTSLQALQFH